MKDFAGLPGRIKAAREEYPGGMSREQLGKFLGVSRQAVARWEQPVDRDRNSVPDLETLNEIANVLGVDFFYLLVGQKYIPDIEGAEGSFIPIFRLDDFHLKQTPLFHRRTLLDIKMNTEGFQVPDASNMPNYSPRDVCVTQETHIPQPGEIMVARLPDKSINIFGKCSIAGYHKNGQPIFEIAPLNEAYPRFSSDRDELHLLAVVIEHHRNLRNQRQIQP